MAGAAVAVGLRPPPFLAGASGRCCRRRHEANTRPRGEPSWHRRARRARADARVVARLAAARGRLAAHHSAQFNGMFNGAARRHGGGGRGNAAAAANGDDGFLAARQFFMSLFGGGPNGNGRQSGGGGGGGAAMGRRGGSNFRAREDEWACICGFGTNRAWREACHSCGRARCNGEVRGARPGKGTGGKTGAASGKGGSGNKGGRPVGEDRYGDSGPVGANGNRPMLGGHGSGHGGVQGGARKGKDKGTKGGIIGELGKGKGPGGAQAGGAGARPGTNSQLEGDGDVHAVDVGARAKGAWAKPLVVRDAEGYELVQPRRVRVQPGQPERDEAGSGEQQQAAGAQGLAPARRLWSDEDSDDDQMDDDDADLEEQEDLEWSDDAGADPSRLKAEFEAHARAVRDMEKKGSAHRGSPALETLRAARDAAERAWRDAKEPAPLPTRMGRAEAKLEKAQAALTRARYAVEEFDAWAESQREGLVQRMHEADSWLRWRQRQLDDLHEEAAERVPKKPKTAEAERNGEVSDKIRGELLPTVQLLIEHTQGNP